MNSKIRLGIDARMVQHSGIGTYLRQMLDPIIASDEFDITLFGPIEKISDYPCRKVHAPYKIYSLAEQILFPKVLRRVPIDCYYFPHYNIPLGFKGNIVVTIHDLIHLVYPPSKLAYFYAKTMIKASCRKAKRIVATSDYTKEDLRRVLGVSPEKVTVIHTGPGIEMNSLDSRASSRNDNQRRDDEPPYILYVGNIKPSKNVETLIEAFLIAKKKILGLRLVIVGKNSMPQLTDQYKDFPEISFVGEVSFSKLSEFYTGAHLFVFPSLYEGFGLPPLEAMSLGVPVIAANTTSLPEVCGSGADYFDPDNIEMLAEKILGLWSDTNKREEFIKKGFDNVKRFSWEKCANEMASLFKEACLN